MMASKHLLWSLTVVTLVTRPCYGRLQGRQQPGRNVAFSEPPENMFDGALVSHPLGSFTPLECNDNLDEAVCTSFSSSFKPDGTGGKFTQKVTIPCGKCIVMDSHRGALDLLGGLDIQGKLLIPDGLSIKMRVTSILVQGELQIVSSKPIDGNPDVQIIWLAANSPVTFIPENSTEVCGGHQHACDLGRKPFIVAGGKVDIRGLPDEDMPTWVPLYDVEASTIDWAVPESQYQTYKSQPNGCPSDGILIKESVAMTTLESVFVIPDRMHAEISGNSVRVSDRRFNHDGVTVDLEDIRPCLVPDQTYVVTARVRVLKEGLAGYTKCATSGKGCVSVAKRSHKKTGALSEIWTEHQSLQSDYGQEFIVTTEVSFQAQELDGRAPYNALEFYGPKHTIEIEVSDVTFVSPPPEAFYDSDTVCGDMVPPNGDAELFELSPFPFRTSDASVHLSVIEEDSNRFFRVTGRDFKPGSEMDIDEDTTVQRHKVDDDDEWSDAGLTWSVPHDCIKRQSTYRIHADVRVHGEHPIVVEFNIQGESDKHRAVDAILAKCPPSQGDWVSCDAEFSVPKRLIAHSDRYQIIIRTQGSALADYDVDNLSFELIEGPIDQLILPNSVQGTWTKGAQIMLTSHTMKWNTHQLATISKVQDSFEQGYVNVHLEAPIIRPTTAVENPLYATEVALMSRNIIFDGSVGAHFTVLHTPYVAQIIQGADFSTFGSAGDRDHYPILFDNCHDSTGSIVSKNTIRRSGQRCVVLHATNNVLVEGNVAHDTAGHCYALESGAEVGNMFLNNLGAFTRPSRVLMPQFGASGKETDDTPATFWITNPRNAFEGNVAAGSEGYGFWMPLADRPRGPHSQENQIVPSHLAIGHFAGNAAHSINRFPLKVSGYHSPQYQSIAGFRAYLGDNYFELTATENVTLTNVITDQPLDDSMKRITRNATVVEMLGCDDASAYLEYLTAELETSSQSQMAPSAQSVFNLQES